MLMRTSAIFFRQTLLKANVVSQEVNPYRCIHLAVKVRRIPKGNSLLDLHRYYRVTGISLARYSSTNETIPPSPPSPSPTPQSNPYDEIPDPPTLVQEIVENVMKYHPNGEPTLESLGLGGYNPVALIRNSLEFMHIHFDIPWWSTIVIGTICIRLFMFPLIIYAQKKTINISNHMPMVQKLQKEMTEARQSGDYYESARIGQDLMQYMKKHNISFFGSFIMPFVQAPVFISFFLALRSMANLPVESMKEGGFWWMKDLTIHDPYYIMPVVTAVTLYITIEVGADGTNIKNFGLMRYFLRALPFVVLPFMLHFPGTVITYWASTNLISLLQTGILKMPSVREALNMPVVIQHTRPRTNNKGGFVNEFKEAWTNMKISKQLSDRERIDVAQFNKAGKGPIIKTFKFDPTKQKLKQTTVLTKGR